MKFETLQSSDNLAVEIRNEKLKDIGAAVVREYKMDKESRAEWEERMEEANKLALQVKEEKTFPWPGAANVKFPLVTIAALQFSARAYPALISGTNVVKCRVIGKDPQGMKKSRAERVSQHMSYQILEEDESWEEEMDRLLMCVPIQGCSFKKSYFDDHNISEHVLAQDLIVPYFAKSLEAAARKTHVLEMPKRQIREMQLKELFLDVELPQPQRKPPTGRDEREGIYPPMQDEAATRTILEQHRFLDLDDDGYEEPYIVTVDKDTEKVLRIVQRFGEVQTDQDADIQRLGMQAMEVADSDLDDAQKTAILEGIEQEMLALRKKATILKIKPKEYFTKYPFIPAPDGGFYDLGFGALLGPVNETVNTVINQLIDSGTLANANTGFIGRGARIKGGKMVLNPFEWQKVDVPGGDLAANIVPFPAKQPSPVLFNLLSLLINYGERLSSVTDTMVGENPGQNTPAYTSQQMLNQGMKVFVGIFKRMYRSMRDEFRKLYELNRENLDPMIYFEVIDGSQFQVYQADYTGDPKDIRPAADPNVVSSEEKIAKAQFVTERAQMAPGYNTMAAEKRLLEAVGVEDTEEVYPTADPIPPPENPEMKIKAAELELQANKQKTEIALKVAETQAKIQQMEAQSILARAKAAREISGIELDAFDRKMNEMKENREALSKIAELEVKEKEIDSRERGMAATPGN